MTRDSMLLWVGFLVAVVTYLTSASTNPMQWGYSEWLQAASFILAWVMGKLATSPLPISPQGRQAYEEKAELKQAEELARAK